MRGTVPASCNTISRKVCDYGSKVEILIEIQIDCDFDEDLDLDLDNE